MRHHSTSSSGHGRESNNASLSLNHISGERRTPRGASNARLLPTTWIVNFQPKEDRTESPSTSDFQTFELLEIVEQFAVGFDELPVLIPGRDDYRILISTGVVVHAYSVVGQATADGAVELVSLDLDTNQDWS